MKLVCFRCANRQENDTACGSCGNDIVHDLGEGSTWRYLRDIEQRAQRQRQAKIIGIASLVAVVLAIGFYIAALVYYGQQEQAPSNAILRVLVAAALGAGLATAAVLEQTWGKQHFFPFLDQEDEIRGRG